MAKTEMKRDAVYRLAAAENHVKDARMKLELIDSCEIVTVDELRAIHNSILRLEEIEEILDTISIDCEK